MTKVLVTTSSFAQYDQSPLEKLQNSGYEVVLNPYSRKLSEDEITGLLYEHKPSGLLAGVEPLTKAVLQSASPKLIVISRCGIGMDSVDLKAAKALGIKVTNTPDAPTVPVAELTMGLILSLLRHIHLSDAAIRSGQWERPMGQLLYGKTVGLVGCGRIGTRMARILSGFDCRVLGTDPVCPQSDHFELQELEPLLDISDIISLHLTYDAKTHHFMNAEHIQMMKKGAYLINTARGGLVDEEALYEALTRGHLSGAALDTFEQEPYRGPLKNLKNVLLTGHIGSYAREARTMMEMQAVVNLLENL